MKNRGEVKIEGDVLIYNLIKTFLSLFFTGCKLRPLGIGIEATASGYVSRVPASLARAMVERVELCRVAGW